MTEADIVELDVASFEFEHLCAILLPNHRLGAQYVVEFLSLDLGLVEAAQDLAECVQRLTQSKE